MSEYSERMKRYQGFPWLIFKLGNTKYAINSKIITYISALTNNITPVPNSSNYIEGIMKQRGEVIPLLGMRILFGINSLENEYKDFEVFMERVKKAHTDWVYEFKKSIENNTTFNKEKNPENCEFGRWYKTYETNNEIIAYHMKKIKKPHDSLHALGNEVEKLEKMSLEEKETYLREVIYPSLERYSSKVLKYLDKILSVMQEDSKRMVITIKKEDLHIGIIVDAVYSVEKLECISDFEAAENSYSSKYVIGVGKSEKNVNKDDLILLLDEDVLINSVKTENIDLKNVN